MRFKYLSLALLISAFLPLLNSQAAKIKNLTVSADSQNLNLLWDPLSSTDFADADGYAIQFSKRQADVQITKSALNYVASDDKALRRNTFDNNTFYYARVYTYKVGENNRKILGNGSDLLKFKVDFNDSVTTETIAITDPVILNSSGEAQDNRDYEFGVLRNYAYDSFADFFWSQPRLMTSFDFDGFMIQISKNSDMADPLVKATVDSTTNQVRITGLNTDTSYYTQGFFYKDQGGEKKTFGDSPIVNLKTITAVPRDNSSREARNIVKIENRAIRKINVNNTSSSSSSDSSTSATSTTPSNSTSTSTNVSTSSQSEIDRASQAEVKRQIADIKRKISQLETELKRWEVKLDTSSRTTNNPSKTSPNSTRELSLKERLKRILDAKRNQ